MRKDILGKEKHTRNASANENYLKKKRKQKGGKEIKFEGDWDWFIV